MIQEILSDLNQVKQEVSRNIPTSTDNRLTTLLRPDKPIYDTSNIPQKPVDYTLQSGESAPNIAKKFVVSTDYAEEKLIKSGTQKGDRLTDILAGGYPPDLYNLPTFVKQQEAVEGSDAHLVTHKPSDASGFTIGYGYDTNQRSLTDAQKDFKEAGIDPRFAKLVQSGKRVRISPEQADKLGAVTWRENYTKGINIGLPLDTLDKRSRDIALSLLYRGDVVKNGENYRGKLYTYIKNNNLDGALNYIKNAPVKNGDSDNIGIPKDLKTRWEKIKI